jgi:hypothetical protein
MILLPQVTLLSVDTVHPVWSMQAMLYSMRHCCFADAVLLTDLRRHNLGASGVRTVHHAESNSKVSIGHRNLFPDYERANLLAATEISTRIKTKFVLKQEWDAAVLNPGKWAEPCIYEDDPRYPELLFEGKTWGQVWMMYDYVGSPWVPHCDYVGVPCDGASNNVGNSGFSLCSMKYCKAVRAALEEFKDDPFIKAGKLSCDIHPSIVWRPWLEKVHGIRFAPENVAFHFSCECRIYAGEFGYHGKETAVLNNWRGVRGTWSEIFAHVTENC